MDWAEASTARSDTLPMDENAAHAITRDSRWSWAIEPQGSMQVPVRSLALPSNTADPDPRLVQQLCTIAAMPGAASAVWAFPESRISDPAPEGLVFVTNPDEGGVVAPSILGDGIGRGVLLLTIRAIGDEVDRQIISIREAIATAGLRMAPGWMNLGRRDVADIFMRGPMAIGSRMQHAGVAMWGDLPEAQVGADAAVLSETARNVAQRHMGTSAHLGESVSILRIDRADERDAAALEGDIAVIIASDSRGVAREFMRTTSRVMSRAAARHMIRLPDRRLTCAPVHSHEGREFLAGMAGVLNYSAANRLALAHRVVGAIASGLGVSPGDLHAAIVSDVSYSSIRFELHGDEDRRKRFCVHRRGATAISDRPIAIHQKAGAGAIVKASPDGTSAALGSAPERVVDVSQLCEALSAASIAQTFAKLRPFGH